MLDRVNTALLELMGALSARSLYPVGHPHIVLSEERAHTLLQDLLTERPEINLFVIDDRVIFENNMLPSSSTLSATFFEPLQQNGVDQLTFRRGLKADEISSFLDRLANQKDHQDEPLTPSKHLGLSSLSTVKGIPQNKLNIDSATITRLDEIFEALPDMWANVEHEHTVDTSLLGDIVSSLSRVVSKSTDAFIPLAPLKAHDEYTFVHTINVAMLSASICEVLGFDSTHSQDLTTAALLHDIGKQAIPKEILNKPGRFTDEEFDVMKAHPVSGARILLNTPGVNSLSAIVAFEHHIRADGSGYPKVPHNWTLNLASRIVQMADIFDALRTDRPYRPGQPVSKIIEIMKQDVGTIFDPDLLMIFIRDVIARGIPDSSEDYGYTGSFL
jgi:putative nucleotidyltransferase with HDIG domain